MAGGGGGGGPAAAGGGAPRRLQPNDPAAARAWRRLCGDVALRRDDRTVAFKLLHGALPVAGFRLHTLAALSREAGLCPCPPCRRAERLETLTHAFLECPAAAPVLGWALALWAALTPGAPQPPRDALLLLGDMRAGEGGAWAPQPQHAPMWGRLRVAWLGAVWEARCLQCQPGAPAMSPLERARATAEALLARLNGAARLHWRRVACDVRKLSPQYPSAWFRGRKPAMSLEDFLQQWSMGGRFCEAELQPRPEIRTAVTASLPVPVPGAAGWRRWWGR